MPQHDDLSPERLDALVDSREAGGTTPEEQPFAALMSELRGSEGAPDDVRTRVRELVRPRESAVARLVRRARKTSWTQRAVALAPACVLVVGTVFAVSSITSGGQPGLSEAGEREQVERAPDPALAAPIPPAAGEAKQAPLSEATLSVRVANADAIAAAGRAARAIAEAQGGRTVSEQYARTGGAPREAVVTIEVPADRYEGTRTALARIGTISDEITAFRAEDVTRAPSTTGLDPSSPPNVPTATITVTFTTAR